MTLQDRVNDNPMMVDVPMDAERIHKFSDLNPVLGTPMGLAVVGGMATAAVAGSEIGKNAD